MAAAREVGGIVPILDYLCLPDMPRVIFERSPLMLAVCQVRFSPILSVTDSAYVAPFQRAIQKDYPILQSKETVEVEVSLESDTPKMRRSSQWQFSDTEENWFIVLAQDFLTLEARRYEYFEDFLQRLRKALTALIECLQSSIGSRIGLRYINEIRDPKMPWASVINRELLGPLAVAEIGDYAALAVQELRLRFPDNESVTIRHGLMPGKSTVQSSRGEQLDTGPFYLLDFDVFRTFTTPDSLPMDSEDICQHIAQYHCAIDRLFRWSVTEEFSKSLGVRENEVRANN